MRTVHRRSRSAAALLAVAFLTAACTSDPEPDGQAQPEAAAPDTTALAGPTTTAVGGDEAGESGELVLDEFPVPEGSRPHDVAPAPDGGVWFTGQRAGYLGLVDPASGKVTEVPLGGGAAPHGVISDADGNAWVTDQGLNAVVRVDAATLELREFPLPGDRPDAGVHTATFAPDGMLWFTGQAGVYGRLDPAGGDMRVYDAPDGPGPYGITATPDGDVYYASLAASHIARVDPASGEATVIEPPTPDQGARRIWSDSGGTLWVSEWNAGQLANYDPATQQWREWPLPGDSPQAYAVFVDDRDTVWVSDFGSNRLFRFDPATEQFTPVELPGPEAEVRQLLGRPGEVLGAASALDRVLILHTAG
jgi:virginiamycin B lyase